MKCVVTGGCGFLGSHVAVELERRGLDVVIFDQSDHLSMDLRRSKLVVGDVRDMSTLAGAICGASYIFHLSGLLGTFELFARPAEAIDVNIKGALNLFEAVRAAKQAADIAVFLPGKPNGWNNIYSVTAQAVEKMGHAYRDAFGLDVRVLRLRNVYGPRQSAMPVRKMVPLFILQARSNSPITIFGDGSQAVQLYYIEDVAKIIVDYTFSKSRVVTTYDLTSQQEHSVLDVAHLIRQKVRSNSIVENRPARIGEQSSSFLESVPDILELLGPRKLTSLSVGLERTVDWYCSLPQELSQQVLAFYAGQDQ
jgi:UDP-glucose 4-epimerase